MSPRLDVRFACGQIKRVVFTVHPGILISVSSIQIRGKEYIFRIDVLDFFCHVICTGCQVKMTVLDPRWERALLRT